MTNKKPHAPQELLARYAVGDAHIPVDALWALEAHLETCAVCRSGVAHAVTGKAPDSMLLEHVHAALAVGIATSRQIPVRRRWLRRFVAAMPGTRWLPGSARAVLSGSPGRTARWAPPTLVPWLAMTGLMVLIAVGFDLLGRTSTDRYPSLVLLFAPVAPLLGMAAAWSQARDPAHEVVTAAPRAGLYLVLRRTLAVLAVVIPALAAAGFVVGAPAARWLLPCLAVTVGALALGEVIGLTRASTVLGIGWAVAVIAPSLALARPPAVLAPETLPAWAVVTTVAAVVVVLRRHAFTRLLDSR